MDFTFEGFKALLSTPTPIIEQPIGAVLGFILVAYGIGSILWTKKRSVVSILIGIVLLALLGVKL